MTITAHVRVSGYLEGLPAGSRAINLGEINNPLSVDQAVHVELANGDNTIPIPTGASGTVVGVIVMTDPTGTTVKTVRTTGMASGIPLKAASGVVVLHFSAPPPTTIIVNSVGAEVGKLTSFVFF